MTPVSDMVRLPKTKNDVLFFHGIKSQDHYNNIKKNYDESVMDCEEVCISYENYTLLFEKNSFLSTKTFKNDVIKMFKIDLQPDGQESLSEQSPVKIAPSIISLKKKSIISTNSIVLECKSDLKIIF